MQRQLLLQGSGGGAGGWGGHETTLSLHVHGGNGVCSQAFHAIRTTAAAPSILSTRDHTAGPNPRPNTHTHTTPVGGNGPGARQDVVFTSPTPRGEALPSALNHSRLHTLSGCCCFRLLLLQRLQMFSAVTFVQNVDWYGHEHQHRPHDAPNDPPRQRPPSGGVGVGQVVVGLGDGLRGEGDVGDWGTQSHGEVLGHGARRDAVNHRSDFRFNPKLVGVDGDAEEDGGGDGGPRGAGVLVQGASVEAATTAAIGGGGWYVVLFCL